MRFFNHGIWKLPLFFQINPCQLPRWRWPNLCLDNSALPPSRRPVLTFCCGDLWRLLVWYLMFKQIKNKQNMFFPCWSHSSWSYSIQPLCSEFRNCGSHAPQAEGRRHSKIKKSSFPPLKSPLWGISFLNLFKTNPSPVFIGKIHILLIKSNSNPVKIPLKSHFCWLNPFFDASTSSAPSACRAGWRSLRSRAKERPRRQRRHGKVYDHWMPWKSIMLKKGVPSGKLT